MFWRVSESVNELKQQQHNNIELDTRKTTLEVYTR